jgi:hypothetical protein
MIPKRTGLFVLAVLPWLACNVVVTPPQPQAYNNTTDPTNRSAAYIGADACGACHSETGDQHAVHGHSHKLKPIQGEPPTYPEEGTRAGVPDPPEGFAWADVAYVIGGYTRKARFVDNDGFILTTGLEGVATQWNLAFPANGTEPGFVPYEPTAEAPKPYDHSCFVCHTTGARPRDEDFPEFQDNRPGLIGTWREPGVQCEACHGPGSNHVPNTARRDMFVDLSASACGKCHTRGGDPQTIESAGGYIKHHEQWPELLASGGHAEFGCAVCHDPHVSANYDRANAIRSECTTCHPGQNMAIHEGKMFVRGDYRETLSCESCHMPFVTKSAASAGPGVVGNVGRMGDTRTHIFRIETTGANFQDFFTADGSAVVKDNQRRAAVTLDFVCFRCHNDIGNAASFSSLENAANVAEGMHELQLP